MSQNIKWEELIKAHLLKDDIIQGAAFLSQQGGCIYSVGKLDESQTQHDWLQFTRWFLCTSASQEEELFKKGFDLMLTGRPIHFVITNKTFCSIYAIAGGKGHGLIVCNLPYGVMVCVYSHPHHMAQAVQLVEQFADKLRA